MTVQMERLIDHLTVLDRSPWMRLEAAAEYLTVSPAWLDRSDCPRSRLGRRVVFYRHELDAFALAHMTHRVDRGDS